MLFLKEGKKALFSFSFLLYLTAVLAMYFTQFAPDCKTVLEKPGPGLESYGSVAKEIPEIMMPNAIKGLVSEYLSGSFTAYPIGFYKEVKLKEKQKEEMAEIIRELSGITREELDNFTDFEPKGTEYIPDGQGGYILRHQEATLPEISIPEELTYGRFRELMRQADHIIGGGSRYSDDDIVGNFSTVPKSYEDALAEYQDIFEQDKITGAYARLFCDYLGIVVSILPVFLAASFAWLDKKSWMEQLIFTRRISSLKLIGVRYLALCVAAGIPVLLAAVAGQRSVMELYSGYEMDPLAFFRYGVAWIMPNILLAVAMGMLFTELTSPLIAIFVQGLWWFSSIFAGTGGLTGNIGRFTLVLRHNSLWERELFLAERNRFLFNRIFYTILSILMVLLTMAVYESKRRGSRHGFFRIPKNSCSKSEA